MKPSLAQERQALLEQIEASRQRYRRMLADTPASRRQQVSLAFHRAHPDFPRSHTLRWVNRHPWLIAAGAGSVLGLAVMRLNGKSGLSAGMRGGIGRDAVYKNPLQKIATLGSMLLHHKARLQLAGRLTSKALRWLNRLGA